MLCHKEDRAPTTSVASERAATVRPAAIVSCVASFRQLLQSARCETYRARAAAGKAPSANAFNSSTSKCSSLWLLTSEAGDSPAFRESRRNRRSICASFGVIRFITDANSLFQERLPPSQLAKSQL